MMLWDFIYIIIFIFVKQKLIIQMIKHYLHED